MAYELGYKHAPDMETYECKYCKRLKLKHSLIPTMIKPSLHLLQTALYQSVHLVNSPIKEKEGMVALERYQAGDFVWLINLLSALLNNC